MDLRKIRHASILAKEGNFARAARALHLTQPALSRSIKALEQELGLLLFDRLSNGTRPTAAGRRILDMGEALLRSARGIENEAHLLRRAESGELNFGIGPMLVPLLKNALSSFYTGDRHIDLQVVIEPIGRMLELLLADQIEFFISAIAAIAPSPDVEIRELTSMAVGYYVRTGHPLSITGADKSHSTEDYILATPRLNIIGQWPKEEGLQPFPSAAHIQCDNIEVMKKLATSSDAILLALEPALEPELSQGKFRRLPVRESEENAIPIGLVKLANRSLSPAAEEMLGTLRSEHFLS